MEKRHRSLLDLDLLRRLLQQLEATDVDELEIRSGASRLHLRREPEMRVITSGFDQSGRRSEAYQGEPVAAPLTGVLYTRASPELPPFVSIGDTVEVGQVVALIETMKLFNEVTVEIKGVVLSLAKQEGELVEVGQPLLYLRPSGEGYEC